MAGVTQNIPEDSAIIGMLRGRGITPTSQRIEIARLLFSRCEHMSAESIYNLMNAESPKASKATVYNTLGLFTEQGLIRELIVDPERIYYDPNTAPHHHFYDVTTGKLTDVDADLVQVTGMPALPAGSELEGMDVIIRVRSASGANQP